MKKFLIAFTLLIIVLAGCSSKGSGGDDSDGTSNGKDTDSSDVIELSLGTKMPDETSEGRAFNYFAELVEEKTNGEVIVNVYPAEQLGTGTTQIDNMVMGTQDMYAEGAAYFRDFEPRLDVSTIPYLFEGYEQFQEFFQGDIGQEIHENLIEQGMRILNSERNFVRGPYRVLLATDPIQTLDDVQGLMLRSHESAIYADAWTYLGANPTVIAWTETYLAIRQGTVDAVSSPISLVKGMNFAEVAPYMTIIDEYPQDVPIVIAEDSFQELNEEQQQHLIDAAHEASEYGTQLALDEIEEDIEFMKEENGLEIFEIDTSEWSEYMDDFHYQLVEDGVFDKELIDYIKGMK